MILDIIGLILCTLIACVFTFMAIIGLVIIIANIREIPKNKKDEDRIAGNYAMGFIFFILGGLVSLLLWSLAISSWNDTIDAIKHPCVEYSNPYLTGGLDSDKVCIKRKE